MGFGVGRRVAAHVGNVAAQADDPALAILARRQAEGERLVGVPHRHREAQRSRVRVLSDREQLVDGEHERLPFFHEPVVELAVLHDDVVLGILLRCWGDELNNTLERLQSPLAGRARTKGHGGRLNRFTEDRKLRNAIFRRRTAHRAAKAAGRKCVKGVLTSKGCRSSLLVRFAVHFRCLRTRRAE